jgi:hypothetical protein
MPRKDAFAGEVFQLRHTALRNALYHTARRRWLEGLNRLFNFLVIVAGTGAATNMLGYFPAATPVVAVLIAVIGALQLVCDFSGRACIHENLQQRYYNLMADIEECEHASRSQCLKWQAEFTRIAGVEPPTMRALDAIADNQATSALLRGGPRLQISWLESLTRNLLAHNNSTFPIRADWQEERRVPASK